MRRARDEPIERLIARSSLGEPAAIRVRRLAPGALVRAINEAYEKARGEDEGPAPMPSRQEQPRAKPMTQSPVQLPPRYRFLEHLGTGGFGMVCKALDLATNTVVAIKTLHKTDEDAQRRFLREARLLKDQIDNMFVVDVLDFMPGPPPMMVMEYCTHGSLRARVGELGWPEALGILSHASQGLHGIHRTGGFHRDIKPDNLLVAEDGRGRTVKVGDFGIARVPETGPFPMTRSPFGTVEYLPPEVLAGKPYTAPGDVYALGITMIELMTGSRAVRAAPKIPGAPAAFITLLEEMIHVQAAARPTIPDIAQRVTAIHAAQQPRKSKAAAPKAPGTSSSGLGMLGTVAALGLGWAALAALAERDDRTWDVRVGRYRRRDGTFAPDD